jgi:hypothetical protein
MQDCKTKEWEKRMNRIERKVENYRIWKHRDRSLGCLDHRKTKMPHVPKKQGSMLENLRKHYRNFSFRFSWTLFLERNTDFLCFKQQVEEILLWNSFLWFSFGNRPFQTDPEWTYAVTPYTVISKETNQPLSHSLNGRTRTRLLRTPLAVETGHMPAPASPRHSRS